MDRGSSPYVIRLYSVRHRELSFLIIVSFQFVEVAVECLRKEGPRCMAAAPGCTNACKGPLWCCTVALWPCMVREAQEDPTSRCSVP